MYSKIRLNDSYWGKTKSINNSILEWLSNYKPKNKNNGKSAVRLLNQLDRLLIFHWFSNKKWSNCSFAILQSNK